MLIENFTGSSVAFLVGAGLGVVPHLEIYGSAINDNQGSGLTFNSPSGSGYVHDSSFNGNGGGVSVLAQTVVINRGFNLRFRFRR